MKHTIYLVSTLIESADCVSDSHQLHTSLESAQRALLNEIEEAKENFFGEGEIIIDLPRCVEWRNPDGYGYIISIEEYEVNL